MCSTAAGSERKGDTDNTHPHIITRAGGAPARGPPRTPRTCLARNWFSSFWLLSTCLDMMPSDDRLSSKFSIVPLACPLREERAASSGGGQEPFSSLSLFSLLTACPGSRPKCGEARGSSCARLYLCGCPRRQRHTSTRARYRPGVLKNPVHM